MMVLVHLLLSLVTLSLARSIAPPIVDPHQVPVSDTRFDDGAVNFGSGMPLPGFTPGGGPQYGSLGGPTGYGGQPAYGGGQPAYGGQPPAYGAPQPAYDAPQAAQPAYVAPQPSYGGQPQPGYGGQPGGQPGYGGQGGYGQPGFPNSGYGAGFMSTPV